MWRKKHNDVALLLIRFGLAVVFIGHGWVKIADLSGFTQIFGSLGIPAFLVYVVAFVEFGGGIALLLGIFVRPFSFLLAIDMFFAIILVKIGTGLPVPYEFELVLLLNALALMFTGPGRYSLARRVSAETETPQDMSR